MLIIGSMSIMVVPPGTDGRTGEFFDRLWDQYRLTVIFSERLAGKWGVTDVEDCVSAVFELGRAGLVDPKRVAIRGGSAGVFVPQARERNSGYSDVLLYRWIYGAGGTSKSVKGIRYWDCVSFT
jgi:hypothetical protein